MLPGAAHPRPLPHRRQDEQGVGRGPRRRITQDGPGGPRAAVEEVALVRPQTQRESHLSAEVPSARSAPLQPPDRPCLSPQRRFSAVLVIQLADLGWHVPGLLVLSNDAIPHRADEEDRPDVARSPHAAAQLFQGQEAVFQRRGRGSEQQSPVSYTHLTLPTIYS